MTEAANSLVPLPLDTVVVRAPLAGTDVVLPRPLVVVRALCMENIMVTPPVVVAETPVMRVVVVAMSIASAALLAVVVVVARLRLLVARILTCHPPVPSSLSGTTRLARV
jgi:hypothetical protein